jgi:diaminopimelate epimerase
MNETFEGIPLERGELRAGFGVTGVPHLVILCDDIERPDVVRRGAALRYDRAFAAGTNVNWIAAGDSERSEWRYRTYERGVEDETLACGTGAVTCAALLRAWGLSGGETRLRTRSGKVQTVRLEGGDGVARASLAGEARIVFEGTLRELD